jgi:hypothetical protein
MSGWRSNKETLVMGFVLRISYTAVFPISPQGGANSVILASKGVKFSVVWREMYSPYWEQCRVPALRVCDRGYLQSVLPSPLHARLWTYNTLKNCLRFTVQVWHKERPRRNNQWRVGVRTYIEWWVDCNRLLVVSWFDVVKRWCRLCRESGRCSARGGGTVGGVNQLEICRCLHTYNYQGHRNGPMSPNVRVGR